MDQWRRCQNRFAGGKKLLAYAHTTSAWESGTAPVTIRRLYS